MNRAAAAGDFRLYLDGLACFDEGAFFECHELLEEVWLRDASALRPFFQGLIQLAAAFVHLQRGRHVGLVALLRAAEERLRPFAPATLGVDVAHLLLETTACRIHAESLEPHRLADFDPSLMVRLRFTPPTMEEFWHHRGGSSALQ
jgi:hypothetical protein